MRSLKIILKIISSTQMTIEKKLVPLRKITRDHPWEYNAHQAIKLLSKFVEEFAGEKFRPVEIQISDNLSDTVLTYFEDKYSLRYLYG